MSNKKMAEIFSDVISSSMRPTMAGENGREHRGYITVNDELISALLHAQSNLVCDNVRFGDYQCYSPTNYGFDVDMCLVPEINSLNSQGIKTIGCCCGHNQKYGYIQVTPNDCEKMEKLGYVRQPEKDEYTGKWCFTPKTILPDPDKKWKDVLSKEETQ